MEDKLTEKTVSLSELNDPEKVAEIADDESPAISVEDEPRFELADPDEVDAAIGKRKDKIQPILDYLKDK